MATKQEIMEHVKIALAEIGKIEPWYDKNFGAWIFEHPSYPVGCEGATAKEVIKKYPRYIKEFITHRLNDNLAPFIEKKTKGRGGKREGAGRPKDSTKEPKLRIYLPTDIVYWIKQHPEAIDQFRRFMAKSR